jgi:hypothetical protein
VSTITCHTCHEAVPSYDTVSYGSIETGYRELCSRCFNEEVAGDLDFEHVGFEPVDMADAIERAIRYAGKLGSLEALERDEQAQDAIVRTIAGGWRSGKQNSEGGS